jgi:hypothetical protein
MAAIMEQELLYLETLITEGRWREAYALALPFANNDDPEAQSLIGTMLAFGFMELDDADIFDTGSAEERAAYLERVDAGQVPGMEWLAKASSAGCPIASYNLGTAVLCGFSGLSPDQAKNEADALIQLAIEQGFVGGREAWLSKGDVHPKL